MEKKKKRKELNRSQKVFFSFKYEIDTIVFRFVNTIIGTVYYIISYIISLWVINSD